MSNRKVTIIFLAAAGLVLGLWDIYVAVHRVEGDTISEVVRHYGTRHMGVPLAAGILVGHFFGRRKKNPPAWFTIAGLAGSAAGVWALERYAPGSGLVKLAHEVPLVPAAVGLYLGYLFWGTRNVEDKADA